MSDLISRQALKERLMYMTRLRTNSEIGEPTCGLTRRTVFHMSEIMKVVIDMPTIEERKTGKWIIQDNPGTGWYRVVCSECDENVTSNIPMIGFFPHCKPLWDYCPYCGADMRGEGHE